MRKTMYFFLLAAFAAIPAYSENLDGYWSGVAEHNGHTAEFALTIEDSDSTPKLFVTCPAAGVIHGRLADGVWENGAIRAESRPGIWPYQVVVSPNGPETLSGKIVGEAFTSELRLARAEWDPPYTTEPLTFSNDDVTLAGRFYRPKGEGPFPAIVHLHGSGDGYVDDFKFWADFLARMGIASLVYDKRGCGDSGGDWRTVGFEPLARDGIAAVNALKLRDDIDAKRIGMTGISQAGWLMPLAVSLGADVSFLVIISGPSIPVEEEGYYDYLVKLRDAGYSEDVLNQARELLEMDRQVVRTGKGAEAVRERVLEVRKEPWFRDMEFIRSPEGGWYAMIVDYDPLPVLQKVEVPMLWVYGMADKSVPPEKCIEILENLKREQNKDYTIVEIPNANHGVRVPPDPATSATPFYTYPPAYPAAVSEWLSARVLSE